VHYIIKNYSNLNQNYFEVKKLYNFDPIKTIFNYIYFLDKQGAGNRGEGDSTETESIDSSSERESEQEGFGKLKKRRRRDSDFVNKIANIVVAKISGKGVEPNSDLSPNAPIIESKQLNLLPYDNIVSKNDESDDFDEKRLLGLISNNHKKKAKELLNKFNENGHLITFNSSGVLFVNGLSIPNSNIFEIFPMLFKVVKSKNIPGLKEILNQIDEMKLSYLIAKKTKNPTAPKNEQIKISDNFWYLG
jgi:hypothetical protein